MIVFVHLNKTAGTTFKFILRNTFGLRHCDLQSKLPRRPVTEDDLCFAHKVFPFGLKSVAGHGLIDPRHHLTGRHHYVTFLRDPLKRGASHYQHIKRARHRYQKTYSFEEFLEDTRLHNLQVKTIAGSEDLAKAKQELANHYHFVGLTERFDESLQILQAIGPERLNLGYHRLHTARENSAKREVLDDPGKRSLLADHNALDRALYRFVQEVLYPAQVQKAFSTGEKPVLPQSGPHGYPFRYKMNRAYHQAVYRTLVKLRRRFW
ncbi:MAG: sulfotransferase family protein [Desulfohalobiaceae bacterium]|nr:sulfotransferase family protein [Desulfohalobiaceae bacterium]